MIPPIPYRGEKPYIFISYSHRDSARVWPIIKQMQQDGYRIWYDEGIDPGTEWDENIAAHVTGCSYFIAFVSENYLKSDNCKDELNFARDLEKKQVLVYLDDSKLPSGMALRFGRYQSFRAEQKGFYSKLYTAEGIQNYCDGKPAKSGSLKGKKYILGGIVLLVLILLAVMWSKIQQKKPAEEPAQEVSQEISFEFQKGVYLRNDVGVKLTAEDFYFDEEGNLVMEVLTENTTDHDLTIGFFNSYLNGVSCEQELFLKVPAKISGTGQLRWRAESLKAVGLDNIQDVEEITVMEGFYYVEWQGSVPVDGYYVYYPYGEAYAEPFVHTPDADDIILVDREDYQLIFTDHFLDDKGDWVGEFVSVNRSDRHLSASLSLKQTNGYQYGMHEVDYIRPGCTVKNHLFLFEWEYTGQDAVRRVDGNVWLRDTDSQETIEEEIPITIYPEGDEGMTFSSRELTASEKILVDNEYVRVALIETVQGYGEYVSWVLYCINLSDHAVEIILEDTEEVAEGWDEWGIHRLEPGQQCFDSVGISLFESKRKYPLDLVVTRESRENEVSRNRIELECER